MGVVNVTPDSFYSGSRHPDPGDAVETALALLDEGADIVDVGGESTRPGAVAVGLTEELERVIPMVEKLRVRTEAMISVDTRRVGVAQRGLEAGADVVNDVSALSDPGMAELIARYRAGVVLMHMKGTPETMQASPAYSDVVAEVRSYLADAMRKADQAGIRGDGILVDPGIGFGKSLEHNLTLLKRIAELHDLGAPVLVGTSRKSFLGRILSRPAEGRLLGSAASVACAALLGAHVLRVHDVAEMREVVRVTDAVRNERPVEAVAP